MIIHAFLLQSALKGTELDLDFSDESSCEVQEATSDIKMGRLKAFFLSGSSAAEKI